MKDSLGVHSNWTGWVVFQFAVASFFALPVRDDGVDVVQATVHPVNLKFHSEFCNTVSLKGFVLLVIEVNAGELSSLIGAGDGERGAGVTELRAKIPIVRVVHPDREVQRKRVSKGNASDFYRVHHRNRSYPKGAASYPFRYDSLALPNATSVSDGRITTTSTVSVQSLPGSGSISPMIASGSDC